MTLPRDPSRPLVITHIPKSGGSSLYAALGEALQPKHPRAAIDETNLASCGTRGMALAFRRRFLLTEDPPIESDYLAGHLSTPHSRRRMPDAQHLLVLREPRARVISHWLFARSFTPVELWAWGEWGNYLRLTHGPLQEFVADPRVACMHDNLVVRLLVGPDPRIPVEGMIQRKHDDELLAIARKRLADYDFVGLLEDRRLVPKIEGWLGQVLTLQRINEARPLPAKRRPDIDTEVRAATPVLLERTRLDRQLWLDVACLQLDGEPARFADNALVQSLASQRHRTRARHLFPTLEHAGKTALLVLAGPFGR